MLQIKPCEKYQSPSKKKKDKKAAILLWTIKKSTRRWKIKRYWESKKNVWNKKKHIVVTITNICLLKK